MRHEARQVPSWLIFDVRQMNSISFRRMWGYLCAVALLLLALSYAVPIDRVSPVPAGRGVGSPFLLIRHLTPEEYAPYLGIACACVSVLLIVILYLSRPKARTLMPYEREGRRSPSSRP